MANITTSRHGNSDDVWLTYILHKSVKSVHLIARRMKNE